MGPKVEEGYFFFDCCSSEREKVDDLRGVWGRTVTVLLSRRSSRVGKSFVQNAKFFKKRPTGSSARTATTASTAATVVPATTMATTWTSATAVPATTMATTKLSTACVLIVHFSDLVSRKVFLFKAVFEWWNGRN